MALKYEQYTTGYEWRKAAIDAGIVKNWFLARYIPIRGTASLVFGMISETMFMKTVRDRRIVTPETITVQENCAVVAVMVVVLVRLA